MPFTCQYLHDQLLYIWGLIKYFSMPRQSVTYYCIIIWWQLQTSIMQNTSKELERPQKNINFSRHSTISKYHWRLPGQREQSSCWRVIGLPDLCRVVPLSWLTVQNLPMEQHSFTPKLFRKAGLVYLETCSQWPLSVILRPSTSPYRTNKSTLTVKWHSNQQKWLLGKRMLQLSPLHSPPWWTGQKKTWRKEFMVF